MFAAGFGIRAMSTAPAVIVVGLGRCIPTDVDLEFIIYAATDEFATDATDTPAGIPFRGTLEQPLRFDRSIVGQLLGDVSPGYGQLVLGNPDAAYDFLPQSYAVDGRDIVIIFISRAIVVNFIINGGIVIWIFIGR